MTIKKRRDLKIILHSDVIWAESGYSVEIKWIIERLVADGWQIAQASKSGLHNSVIDYQGVRIYPAVDDPHGSDTLFYGARHFGAHLAISMIDMWVINPQFLQQLKQLGVRYWAYFPVDSNPITPAVLKNLPFCDKLITFSQFGHDQLAKEGFASELILEGVDTEQLKPLDKLECRKKYGIRPDIFLWGMIAANKENPPRKGFEEALDAFKIFEANHPETYILINNQQISPGNFPIRDYANYLKIWHKLIQLDQLFASIFSTREDLHMLINCFDAVLHPSQTEGFGLNIIESESCGIPVVVNGIHSMPELVIEGKTGSIAKTNRKRWTSMNNFWPPAEPVNVANSMEIVYQMLKKDTKQVAYDCRKLVKEKFNIDKQVNNFWIPALEAVQEQLNPPALTPAIETPKI